MDCNVHTMPGGGAGSLEFGTLMATCKGGPPDAMRAEDAYHALFADVHT